MAVYVVASPTLNSASPHLHSQNKDCSWKRQDNKDLGHQLVQYTIWTGGLPLHTATEEPVARVDVPSYLAEFSNDFTTDSKQQIMPQKL
jgi:hypothetical protein